MRYFIAVSYTHLMRVLNSAEEEIRTTAADCLYSFYFRNEEFDKAKIYLKYFSDRNPEKKRKRAEIYRKTNLSLIHISPRFIFPNTFGSVMNIRLGPLVKTDSSPPEKAKTAGIIIKPARNAIPVSNISICRTEDSRLFSFFI